MAATPHNGLPGTALDTCTAEFIRESRNDPLGTWMILPINRLAETQKQQITARNIPLIPSRITTISALAQTIVTTAYPATRILSPVEQNLIFTRIAENNPDIQNLLTSRTDLPAADETDRDTIPAPGKTARPASVENLVTLYNTLQYRNAALPKGNNKLAALTALFTEYEKFCQTQSAADAPAVLRLAAAAVRSGTFPLHHVTLYGIFSPKERETDLLCAVRDHARHLSEYIPHAANDKIFPAHTVVPADTPTGPRAQFAETVFKTLTITPDLPITKIGIFPDRTAELSAIAEEICRLIESGTKPGDIAILTPEVPLYVELAGELFPDFTANGRILSVTSSIDHPLFRSTSIAAVFSLLKTVLGNYTVEDMTTLFSYPYFRWGDHYISPRDLTWLSRACSITGGRQQWLEYPNHLRTRCTAGIEDAGTPEPEKAELAAKIRRIDETRQKLEAIFTLLDPLGRGRQTADRFIQHLRRILKDLGYPSGHLGSRLPPDDAAAVGHFASILADIETAETLIPPERIPLGRFYTMLFAFVRNIQNTPKTTGIPENEVKILGFREIVHQKIPHIFLAGLTADVLPRVHPRLPYLTMTETLETGTQTYEETLKEERYAFVSAILAAEKSICLSAPASDEGTTKIPSAWLEMFHIPDTSWTCGELPHSAAWRAEHAGHLIAAGTWEEDLDCSRLPDLREVARKITIETVDRTRIPATEYDAVFSSHPLREQFAGRYGTDTCFTITDLERYAACPFRWYTELHLRLTPHPDPELDERTELGNVIHKTMYRLITESEHFPPSKDTRDAAVSELQKIAEEEFAKCGLATPKWQSLRNRYIGTHGHPGRLAEVIDHEIELAELGSTTPGELLEYPFSMTDGSGILLPDGSVFRLEGRIDRIRITGGKYTVTDYKTGTVKKPADIASGRSLQLPLYLSAMEYLHPGWTRGDGTYYRISTSRVEETHPLAGDADCFVTESLLHAARYRNGMRAGICSPAYTTKSVCEHCRERFICRFDRLRSLAGGEPACRN